jgi:hypothetical protein
VENAKLDIYVTEAVLMVDIFLPIHQRFLGLQKQEI